MNRRIVTFVAALVLTAAAATAQEQRHEISVQGTGFFTRDTNSNGITQTGTNSGGVLAGYRFNVNRWLAAEADYGYTRNTQLFGGATIGRVQSDVHAVTADAVVRLPLVLAGFRPYALAGGGALAFRPTQNVGGFAAGADTQSRGTFLYGVGTDYNLSRHLGLRAEYRGLVYQAPDFSLARFKTDGWTHTAQPSVGVVYRF